MEKEHAEKIEKTLKKGMSGEDSKLVDNTVTKIGF
jgi:hypothetical protein